MKNIAFSFVSVLVLFSSAGVALAAPTGWKPAADCVVPPDHGIYDVLTNALTGCITDDAWQKAAAEQAARGDQRLPTFAPGATVTDEHGISSTCPPELIMGFNVCVDLTHTLGYRAAMLDTGRQLLALGYTEKTGGVFAGWIQAAR